jgi:heme A synthase
LSLAALAGAFLVLVSGILVAASGSIVRCLGWPLYGGGSALFDAHGSLVMGRGLLAAATGVLILTLVVQAARVRRSRHALFPAALVAAVLFLIEMVLGVLISSTGFPVGLLVAYVAATAGLWASLVVLAATAGLAAPAPAEEPVAAGQPASSAL